jgi:hypothetical protein
MIPDGSGAGGRFDRCDASRSTTHQEKKMKSNLAYVRRESMFHLPHHLIATVFAGALLLASTGASADHSSPAWGPGQLVIQGAGCPIETPDGLSLMIASSRAGGAGANDIWVIDRPAVGAPWSPAKNLPAPINSTAADFCPSPFERSLYFVSSRGTPCGGATDGGDIYLSRQSPAGDWSEPVHLPCASEGGPNTPGTERSPSMIETWHGTFLFYSTNAGGVNGADEDIYVSVMDSDGKFGEGNLVADLSTPDFQDQMPTVRALGRGYEVTFNSDRPGTFGGQDAYHAQARYLPFKWSKPKNAGSNVNTPANETRASLSWDGERLYVGRGDVWVSERQ